MIIPEKIEEQDEIQKVEILVFYAGKRIIGIATILNELTANYLNDYKLPKDTKQKQISEIIINEEIYTQIDYIDYEPESDDSIYELDELEIELLEKEEND